MAKKDNYYFQENNPVYKIQVKGPNNLSTIELLSIVIGKKRGSDPIDTARSFLTQINDISDVNRLSVPDLILMGLNQSQAIQLKAAITLTYRKSEVVLKRITTSKEAYDVFSQYINDLDHEEFYAIYLNRANLIISTENISKGGYNGTVADPRVIIRRALELKATGIILGHNHPSGVCTPSESDKKLTNRIVSAANYLDIKVLDHIIVSTGDKYFSFADECLIQN